MPPIKTLKDALKNSIDQHLKKQKVNFEVQFIEITRKENFPDNTILWQIAGAVFLHEEHGDTDLLDTGWSIARELDDLVRPVEDTHTDPLKVLEIADLSTKRFQEDIDEAGVMITFEWGVAMPAPVRDEKNYPANPLVANWKNTQLETL